MKDYAKEVLKMQRQAIIDICKEAYPDSVDTSVIALRTHILVNRNIVENLISDGVIEWADEYHYTLRLLGCWKE